MFDTIHPMSWQFFFTSSIDPATLFIDDVFYGRPIIINQFDGKILDWKSGFCLRIMPAYWLYVYFLCFPFHSLVLALNYIMCILTSFCANRKWNYCISISGVPFSHFWEVVGEAVEMMMMWRQARNLLERPFLIFCD